MVKLCQTGYVNIKLTLSGGGIFTYTHMSQNVWLGGGNGDNDEFVSIEAVDADA